MMKKIFFVCMCLAAFKTQAQIGAVSTATGGTGRGAVEPADGILLNPAFLVDLKNKNFSYNYSEDEWALTVSDNGRDSYFPAAFQYRDRKSDAVDSRSFGLSLAIPRIRRIAFGTTISLVEYRDFSPADPELKYRQGVADLALTFVITDNIGFGLVANKAGSTSTQLAENLQLQETLAAGISYTRDNFLRLRLDVETGPDNDTKKLIYMAGLENYINDWIVFRVGYQDNNVLDKKYITAGLGFVGPQFGLHYAYIGNTEAASDQKHLFDLSIPF